MRMVGPNCMGLLNASPAVRLNASFSPIFPPPGHVGLSSQSGALGLAILALAAEPRRRALDVRQRRQQGRRLEQRSARVLGRGRGDARHPAVSRVVRKPAPLRAAGAPHRPHQADRRREGGAHARRIARGGQPHRGARRERRRRRRAVSSVRRDPRRHDRRDVRHRGVPRRAAAAGRPPRRDRHQRRRSRHPRGRRLRVGGADRGAVLRRDARAARRVPAAGREHRQSGRHGRVGRAGRVPAGDRGRARGRGNRRAAS